MVAAKKRPAESDIRKVAGTGENEVGVARTITKDEIVGVWRGDVFEHMPGDQDLNPSSYDPNEKVYEAGSGTSASSGVVWQKVETDKAKNHAKYSARDAAKLKSQWARTKTRSLRLLHRYDDSEPRDDHGKWTSGGGSDSDGGSDGDKDGKGKLGPGYSKDAKLVNGVIHTSSVYDAQRALFEDRNRSRRSRWPGSRTTMSRKRLVVSRDNYILDGLHTWAGHLHEEASDIAWRTMVAKSRYARDNKLNTIVDATLKSGPSLEKRIAMYKGDDIVSLQEFHGHYMYAEARPKRAADASSLTLSS